MNISQDIPWKRMSVEAAAIVVSILLAFAIDAWWEERLERKDEAEQLVRLHAEFVVNVERLSEYRIRLLGGQQAAQEVYEIIQAAQNNDQTNVEYSSLLLRRMIDVPTFEANTPVFDGIIRTGRQVMLEDGRVIASLATWESQVRNYAELAQRTRQNMDLHLVPALSVRGDFGPALMRRFSSSPRDEVDLDPTNVTRIEIDDELKMLVAYRYENGGKAFRNLGGCKEAAEFVIEAIEAAQAD
jgi:hypothetical protein